VRARVTHTADYDLAATLELGAPIEAAVSG
jgi:hypothetical protein